MMDAKAEKSQQETQWMCIVTLRRIQQTTIAMEKQ
jgi:hypothetical protein